MLFNKTLLVFCVVFGGFVSVIVADDLWMTDFDAAKAMAKAENKPIIMNFTGSDWCGFCIRLHKEVFSKASFKEHAGAEWVLVELDFPRRTELSAELTAQNETLAQHYEIRGYPTILVLSPDGALIGKTGYRPGGAEVYVGHIQDILTQSAVQ